MYEASSDGFVRNKITGKILSKIPTNDGYQQVALRKDKICKHVGLHRIIALTFIPNPNNLETVNHKNEDKKDNRVENLEWLSRYDNYMYGSRNERIAQSHKIPVVGLSPEGKSYVFGSLKEASERTGCNRCSISLVLSGKYHTSNGWKWRKYDA